jgi:hypothetical protein
VSNSPNVVLLQFSEPLEYSSVTLPGLVKEKGTSISSCLLLGTSCASANDTVAMNVLNVQLTKSLNTSEAIDVGLGPNTKGAAKTVGSASDAAGYGPEMTSSGLSTAIEKDSWASCQLGAAKCWKWQGVVPN